MASSNNRLRRPIIMSEPVGDRESRAEDIMARTVERQWKMNHSRLKQEATDFVRLGYQPDELITAQPANSGPDQAFVTLRVFLDNGMGPNQLIGR